MRPYDVVRRVCRSALHDLGNSLSAARLSVDIAQRTGAGVGELDAIARNLTAGVRAQAEVRHFLVPSVQDFSIGEALSVMQRAMNSELRKLGADLRVAIDRPCHLEGRYDSFLTVVAAAVFDAVDAGGEGSAWLLRVRADDGIVLEMEGEPGEDGVRSGLDAVFASLAESAGCEFGIWPGENPGHEPDWVLRSL